jgi:hypothetical protein
MLRSLLLLLVPLTIAQAGVSAQTRGGSDPVDQAAPADLKPLLAPRRSEMHLVSVRYAADRALLLGNYAGGMPPFGRGGAPGGLSARPRADSSFRAPSSNAFDTATIYTPPPISPAKIARLKRFVMEWQTALTRLDAGNFSPAARTELDSLKRAVAADASRLDADQQAISEFAPLYPFIAPLVNLVESRLRLEDVQPENAARTLEQVRREITASRARLLDTSTSVAASDVEYRRAAAALDGLRANLSAWFGFYNSYDPMFSWWVPMPYHHADSALLAYATLLRDTLATRHLAPRDRYDVAVIAPSPAPQYSAVPDLDEILALPQDEMTDVVRRYVPRNGRGRGGSASSSAARDSAFYQGWLRGLQSLDFDHLTRNAQVDYLYIRKNAELALARMGRPLDPNPPRLADSSGIPGVARGREGLIRDLEDEFIPYTPEQLLVLAEREFASTTREMLKASHAMGYGNDWKAALEKTKTMHVAPGAQPGMIRDLIFQAVDYLRANDLVTVPEVDAESQRMSMMSPQAQLVSPFFLGGSEIQVSFPTNTMEFEAREESMRGNNEPWSHATAFHEMIPGHNLSGYLGQRFADYRANLNTPTPFFTEGWALYWELTLYSMGFDQTPEERVGALFWRMHRCARIIFSLKFHMGQWSPQQAINFLVDSVGHERDNATAEVRRSFQGGYGPLYQAAYLLGGLELRSMRHDLVDSKQMTNRAFHDEILRQSSMPIALLRLAVGKQKLARDMDIDWKFYGDLPDH